MVIGERMSCGLRVKKSDEQPDQDVAPVSPLVECLLANTFWTRPARPPWRMPAWRLLYVLLDVLLDILLNVLLVLVVVLLVVLVVIIVLLWGGTSPWK